MRGKPSTRLKQSEWDFSKVRDEELHICAWWEYLKEIDEAVRAVKANRFLFHQKKQPTRKQCENAGFTDSDYLLDLPFPFAQDAKWPNAPWNELPEQQRLQIVESYSDESRWHDFYDLSPDMIHELRRIPELVSERAAGNPRSILGRIKWEEPSVDVEYVLVRIDWSMAPDSLVEMFRDWISRRRPADARIKESRGSAGSIRRLRVLLKHLGVWRLLKDMDWKEAVDYTQEILGEPIISDYQHTWARAFKSAEAKIEAVRNRLTTKHWLPVDHYVIRTEMLR